MRCAELLEYGGGGSGTGLGWHWDVGSTLTLVAMLNTSTQVRGRPLPCPLPCPPSDSHAPCRKLARTTHALGGPQQASNAALARHSHHTCTRLAGGRRAAALHQLLGVPRAAAARRCGGRSPLRPALRRRRYILFTHTLTPVSFAGVPLSSPAPRDHGDRSPCCARRRVVARRADQPTHEAREGWQATARARWHRKRNGCRSASGKERRRACNRQRGFKRKCD